MIATEPERGARRNAAARPMIAAVERSAAPALRGGARPHLAASDQRRATEGRVGAPAIALDGGPR